MEITHQETSQDGRWKAKVRRTGFLGFYSYSVRLRDNRTSFFQGLLKRLTRKNGLPRTKTLDLGTEYFDPSSSAQMPNLPIGLSINVSELSFTPTHLEIDVTIRHYYSGRVSDNSETKRISIV